METWAIIHSDHVIGVAAHRWLQGLLEVKQPGPTLHGAEERHCLRLPAPCWHRRRASAGAGPRGRTSASGRYRVDARAGGVRLAWRPARRLGARKAHTKGWGASAAIKSDVSGAQVLNVRYA